MSDRIKTFGLAFAASYLMIGLFLGWAMSSAIPAINWMGVTYYAATWPAWIISGTLDTKWHPPIPNWMFTFPEDAQP